MTKWIIGLLSMVLTFVSMLSGTARAQSSAVLEGFVQYQAGRVEQIVLDELANKLQRQMLFRKFLPRTSASLRNLPQLSGQRALPILEYHFAKDIDSVGLLIECFDGIDGVDFPRIQKAVEGAADLVTQRQRAEVVGKQLLRLFAALVDLHEFVQAVSSEVSIADIAEVIRTNKERRADNPIADLETIEVYPAICPKYTPEMSEAELNALAQKYGVADLQDAGLQSLDTVIDRIEQAQAIKDLFTGPVALDRVLLRKMISGVAYNDALLLRGVRPVEALARPLMRHGRMQSGFSPRRQIADATGSNASTEEARDSALPSIALENYLLTNPTEAREIADMTGANFPAQALLARAIVIRAAQLSAWVKTDGRLLELVRVMGMLRLLLQEEAPHMVKVSQLVQLVRLTSPPTSNSQMFAFQNAMIFIAGLADQESDGDPDTVESLIASYVESSGAYDSKRVVSTNTLFQGADGEERYGAFWCSTAIFCYNSFFVGSYFGISGLVVDEDGSGDSAVDWRPYGPVGLEVKFSNTYGHPLTVLFAPIDVGAFVAAELKGDEYDANFSVVDSPSIAVTWAHRDRPVAVLAGYQWRAPVESSAGDDGRDDGPFLSLAFDLPLFKLY